MIIDFEIGGIKYDYRKDAPGNDGVYRLDAPRKTYVFVDEVTPEIQVEVDRLLAIEASLEYKSKRAKAYPSLEEQADLAYWDRQNSTKTLDEAISAVKMKYPKPV